MNIIIPMAGLGSRFRAAGYSIPKPLIPILGKPMYAWAADCLPLDQGKSLIFVLLASQPEFQELREDILQRYARYRPAVLSVPELTAGQAVTVLTARDLINSEEPLLIHNSDTAFKVDHGWVDDVMGCRADGALLVFKSNEKRWSYSRATVDGWVAEVREKEVISDSASTGTYWFRRGADFVRIAERRLKDEQRDAGEFYVAPLYNELIEEGGRVKNYWIERLLCFGTPEDLARTLEMLSHNEPPTRMINS